MGTLEKIMQLKNQGKTEFQIAEYLKQQGISPEEIDEAFSQSKIKSALSEEDVMLQQSFQAASELQKTTGFAQMQPSMMQTTSETYPEPGELQESSQFTQPMQTIPSSFQPSTSPIMPSPEVSQPYQYSEYQYPEYQAQQIGDIETINEIAEQIIYEKTAQLKNQITLLIRFKEEITLEVEKLNERLLKIENILNELQIAILGKIGDYGKDIKNIAKEMHSTQNSFSKILNPLTDNIREMQKITETSQPSRPKPKTKSSKSKQENSKTSFEDYLR